MRLLGRTIPLVCALASLPVVAHAQQSSMVDRFSVGGIGGVTVGSVTDGAAAGQAGFRIARSLVVFGEGGRMRNVIPASRTDAMEQVVAGGFLRNENADVFVDGGLRVTYGLGGVRWRTRSLFVEGGIGAASVKTQVKRIVGAGSDITREFEAYVVSRGSNLDFPATSEFVVAVGGGYSRPITRKLTVDVGYRFTRITSLPTFNSHMGFVGLTLGGYGR
jgi:opacity protein-like surface antigen